MDWHKFYHCFITVGQVHAYQNIQSIYTVEIYYLVMGNKWLVNIYSDHYALRSLVYLFPGNNFFWNTFFLYLKTEVVSSN